MIKPKYTTYSLIEEQNVMREMMGLSVLVEQTIKVKDGKSKIKIKPKGDKAWQLITTKDFQFDPNNLTADSEVFHQIKRATKIGNLTPEQVMISSKKDGKRRDVSLFMIIPKLTPPEQEEKIRKEIEIKVKNENPDGIKPPSDAVGATSTEQKIYKLGTKYEYAVVDGNWRTRKQVPGTGDWTTGTKEDGVYDLKTNKKATSILDKKYPDAREGQVEYEEETVTDKPDNIVHFQKYANSQGESLKEDNIWGPNTKKAWNKHKGTYKPDDAAASKPITVTKDKGVLFDLDGKKVSYEVFGKEMDRRAKAYEEKTDEFVQMDLDGKKVSYEVWSKEMDRRTEALKANPTGDAASKIQKAVEDNKKVPFVPNWSAIHPWKI